MNTKNGSTGQMRNRTREAGGWTGDEFGPAAAGSVGVDMMFPFWLTQEPKQCQRCLLSQRGEAAQEELRRGPFRTL